MPRVNLDERRAYVKEYSFKHRERKRQAALDWRNSHLEYVRDRDRKRHADHRGRSLGEFQRLQYTYKLRQKYQMDRGIYDQWVIRSQGRCEICGTIPILGLDLDHNHRTGKARGLLCRNCNSIIGKYEPFSIEIQKYLLRD